MRGYIRTSRRTSVSARIGPAIIWLPLAVFVGACKGVVGFFATDRISSGRKLIILLLVAIGVSMAVIFQGSHCDLAGDCHQTQTQGRLAAYGAGIVVVAIFVGILGIGGPEKRRKARERERNRAATQRSDDASTRTKQAEAILGRELTLQARPWRVMYECLDRTERHGASSYATDVEARTAAQKVTFLTFSDGSRRDVGGHYLFRTDRGPFTIEYEYEGGTTWGVERFESDHVAERYAAAIKVVSVLGTLHEVRRCHVVNEGSDPPTEPNIGRPDGAPATPASSVAPDANGEIVKSLAEPKHATASASTTHNESAQPGRRASALLELPPFSVPDSWPAKPGIRILVDLVGSVVEPSPNTASAIEQDYADGVWALKQNEARSSLEHFRSVVAQDVGGVYPTARLLVLLLSAIVGDVATVRELIDPCSTVAQPDVFAQRWIKSCDLELLVRSDDDEPSIFIGGCLDQSAVAAQAALAACMLATGDRQGAVSALEVAIRARALRDEAWDIQRRRIREELNQLRPAILREDYIAGSRRDVDAEALRRATAPHDPAAPRGPAARLAGVSNTLCALYIDLGEPDRVVDYLKNHGFPGDGLWKARALVDKGLPDAALAVYDDCIREGKRAGIRLEQVARYWKAALLLETGDIVRARRELARLYADDPAYEDSEGLLHEVKAPRETPRREAIPEDVRHAVWRRDQGRCVKCDSQEDLEFDHIIPVSRGGSNTERNLQLLCERCNRVKGADI